MKSGLTGVMEAITKDGKHNVFYDEDRDVLYISFGEVKEADDTEMTSDDIVVRFRKGEIIGVTLLGFSKRGARPQRSKQPKSLQRLRSFRRV